MQKKDLMNAIARTGYNVGYGSKKNFSSYDIITTLPTCISILVIIIGIIGLGWPELSNKCVSVATLVVGIISFSIEKFSDNPDDYRKEGERENRLFYKLKNLYLNVKGKDEKADLSTEEQEFEELKNDFYSNTIAKQILLASSIAHFKFFCQYDIKWIEEEIDFKFWRDKVPFSLLSSLVILVIIGLCSYFIFFHCPDCD